MHPTMKNMLNGGGLILVLAVLSAFLITYGRNTTNSSQTTMVNQVYQPKVAAGSIGTTTFVEITHGTQSEIKKRTNYLITSQEGLTKLWKLIQANAPEPKVDFNTHAIIAVFAGQKPTGGYSISVTKIEDGEMRNVVVTLTSPGADCMVTQAVTTPYQIVTVPITSLSFTHNNLETTTSCGQ